MRAAQASLTAQWVAAARSFGRFLPPACRLIEDPYGIRFAEPWLQALYARAERHPTLAQRMFVRAGRATSLVFYMQLRTKFIDDAVREFAFSGGKQVVLLGAGYDARAVRLGGELSELTFFEVDHPATQAEKRAVLVDLPPAKARFLEWNFERRPMHELPAALAKLGHDPTLPTLTIWEGVTMYLQREAIEASFAAIGGYSAHGSPLVFTYFDKHRGLKQPDFRQRATAWLVASVGEPYRFGWTPTELPGWLTHRGFSLKRDVDAVDLAAELLPSRYGKRLGSPGRHFAIAWRQ